MAPDNARRPNPFVYGCPPARYDIRLLSSKNETRELESERRRNVASLRFKDTMEARQLAAQLLSCTPEHRCLLAVCPFCVQQLRVWSTWQALLLFEDEPDLISVTLRPPRAAFAPSDLRSFCPQRFGQALRQQMRRGGLGTEPVYGGIGAEIDDHTDLIRPHFHIVTLSSLRPAFEALAARFYAEAEVRVTPGKPPAYSCAHIGSPAANRHAVLARTQEAHCPSCSRQLSRGQELDAKPTCQEPLHPEWLLWRARYSLTEFLFLSGIRRCGGELRRTDAT
jgi:hypothetical protein